MTDLTERLVALREDARVCAPLMKDYDTFTEAINRLTELEAERDEALRWRWSVEDAVIHAVPDRLARIQEALEADDIAAVRELAYAPFEPEAIAALHPGGEDE